MTTQEAPSPGDSVSLARIYASQGGFAPSRWANARVLAHLLTSRGHALWHFAFAPNPLSSSAARLAKQLRRKPVVQTVMSIPRSFQDVERLLFGDAIVCLSEFTASGFVEAGVQRARLRIIPPPLPPLMAPTQEERVAWLSEQGLHGPFALYPGDVELSCGARVVAHAVEGLLRAHPELTIVFACREKTARAKEAAASLATSLQGHGTRVRFVGEVPSLLPWLAAASVVLFPVDDLYGKVDWPLAILEAMALGTPVITLASGPLAELEGTWKLKAPSGPLPDAQQEEVAHALVETTTALLSEPSRRAEQSSVARAFVEQRCAPERVAQGYESIYDALLS